MKTLKEKAHELCLQIENCSASQEQTQASISASELSSALSDYEAIAGRAYAAYCAAVGGKAFNGDPLPDWKTFRADPAKRKQSDAWVEAAKAI